MKWLWCFDLLDESFHSSGVHQKVPVIGLRIGVSVTIAVHNSAEIIQSRTKNVPFFVIDLDQCLLYILNNWWRAITDCWYFIANNCVTYLSAKIIVNSTSDSFIVDIWSTITEYRIFNKHVAIIGEYEVNTSSHASIHAVGIEGRWESPRITSPNYSKAIFTFLSIGFVHFVGNVSKSGLNAKW